CDDGNECTDSDICDASGFCNGIDLTGTPCTADSDICTDDVCSFGACTHIPNTGNPCDDGNECTNPDACDMGTCDGSDLTGTPCTPDSIVCTDDICSSGSCIHPPNTGNSCNDGVSCTNPDTCDAGVCQGPTDPSLCTDRLDCSTIQCTIERCEYSGCVSTPPGIVLWLPFDGHMDDYSEKRNHGYCMYCPGDTSGHIDGAYNFDGSDDYISVNNDPTLNPNEFTVAAWIYIDILPGSTDWYGIVSKGDYTSGNGYELYVRSSTVANANEITFGLGPDRAYSGFIPSTGEWIHVAGTYNGSYMVLYVNGERRDTVSSGIIPNGGPLFVGRRTSSLSNLFDGRIDDVRVYEIALDDQDIFNLYGGVVTCNDYDANSDGAINIIDLAMVIFAQGRNNIDPYWHAYDHMDVTGDNKINLADINNIISRMGQVC
ncbi:MAG: hypothetical protein KKC05_03075, partial [Nanoarchaeota archaeon]|nr:hypothetical protein [Nanoarchaeota archaeon]